MVASTNLPHHFPFCEIRAAYATYGCLLFVRLMLEHHAFGGSLKIPHAHPIVMIVGYHQIQIWGEEGFKGEGEIGRIVPSDHLVEEMGERVGGVTQQLV
jgi:hypothetical protein